MSGMKQKLATLMEDEEYAKLYDQMIHYKTKSEEKEKYIVSLDASLLTMRTNYTRLVDRMEKMRRLMSDMFFNS